MSMNLYTYIGPFLRCKNTVQIGKRNETKWGCIAEKCDNFQQVINSSKKFCSACGAPNGNFTEVVEFEKDLVDAWKFTEDTGEALVLSNYESELPINIFKPNRTNIGLHISDDVGDDAFPLSPETIAKELEDFIREFSEDIAKAKELYGPSNVEILWGVVTEWA